jgi:hypothetical protein
MRIVSSFFPAAAYAFASSQRSGLTLRCIGHHGSESFIPRPLGLLDRMFAGGLTNTRQQSWRLGRPQFLGFWRQRKEHERRHYHCRRYLGIELNMAYCLDTPKTRAFLQQFPVFLP